MKIYSMKKNEIDWWRSWDMNRKSGSYNYVYYSKLLEQTNVINSSKKMTMKIIKENMM